VVKRTRDSTIEEFRSAVDSVGCADEVQMIERSAGGPEDWRAAFRIGGHIGDIGEEGDGDHG
jgi:hypothetical protein